MARAEDLLPRFKAEYASAAERLEEAYRHVQIKARYSTDRKAEKIVREEEYLRSGDSVRRTLAHSDKVEVRGGDHLKYFVLAKEPGQEFTIKSFGPNTDFDKSSRLLYAPLVAPFCFYGNRVIDHVGLSTVKLLSASQTKLDGENAIEVAMEGSSPKGSRLQRFWFDPESWALIGFQLAASSVAPPKGASRDCRATYEKGQPPKLKVLEFWVSDNGQRKQYERYEITDFEFKEIPESDFRVTAFGIDEPATTREGPGYFWLLLVAIVVLIALSVVFRKLAR
jgi:hypothetical protein